MTLINRDDLPFSSSSWRFEGYEHDAANVSFFLSDTPPGRGPRLHTHPYEEVFIVQEGELTFTVGGSTLVATAGQIVIAPPETPHKFLNSGATNARHVDIHVSPRMVTTWMEK